MADIECKCECHQEGSGIMHFDACCDYCPYCDRNIRDTMHLHRRACGEALKARDPEMFKKVEKWRTGKKQR